MENLADHFGWLIARARRPVIFFIDDLDRCNQDYVVDLLDSVQTIVQDAPKQRGHSGGCSVLRRRSGRSLGSELVRAVLRVLP